MTELSPLEQPRPDGSPDDRPNGGSDDAGAQPSSRVRAFASASALAVARIARRVANALGAALAGLTRGAAAAFSRTRDWLRAHRMFATSLVIGLGIETALHSLHGHPWLERLEDAAMDWTIGLYRGVLPEREGAIPFTVLDIDDATFDSWGSPPYVLRDRLLRLIESAAAARPAAIVVDVDLSGPAMGPADLALAEFLGRYDGAAAPLILVRSLRTPSGDDSGACFEARPSFVDGAVRDRESVVFASALFQRDPDWSIRRWRLWESLCGGEGPDRVVPSIQLLVSALLAEPRGTPRQTLARIENELRSMPVGATHDDHGEGRHRQLRVGAVALTLPPSRLNQRIVYRYPALTGLRENEIYPLDPRTGVPLLSVVSARPLTDGKPTSSEAFAGRVVVIGGSFEAGNDLHPTPLGVMPGAVVLVNAIDSLLEHGEVRAPSRAVAYAIVVAQVIAVAWLFGWFRSIPPAVAACAVLGGLFLPASVLLFKDGYWLDFGLPFVGIQIHRVASRLHEMMGH